MADRLHSVVEEFRSIEDRDTRFDMLIEAADRFVHVPKEVAEKPYPPENLVPGCESEAYAFAKKLPDGTIKLYFAVENPQGISAKAMGVILDENLSGCSVEEILLTRDDIVFDIFGGVISMGKGQGLMNMTKLVKFLAARAS